MIMAATAVLGLSTGKRLFFGSAFVYSDLTDKLVSSVDPPAFHVACSKSSEIGANRRRRRRPPLVTAVREHVDTTPTKTCTSESWMDQFTAESVSESSVDSILLLQKYMLEKQWNLSSDTRSNTANEADQSETVVTASGTSARLRRLDSIKRKVCRNIPSSQIKVRKQGRSGINPGFVTNRARGGYVKGAGSEELLTHSQVVHLSQYIKTGLMLEKHRSRLKERLGCEPSDEQLAHSLRISKVDLHTKLTESTLAREKLARSNARLVMSIAQKYDHMGVEMADLVQGGLIGLLRGIEKFDSSKGFKISTYVYWWIRQGVSRSLMENSKTLRLPTHLHERLSLIRNAKAKLAEKGIAPTIPKIAECLNMTEKKVRNATEAINKVFSLDREAFPSKNGLRGETHHSYVADTQLNNNPWHGYDKWALKDEVDKLITSTLREREREIIRLYYGIGNECLTWEDISRRMGLSRERVRQVGLVAMEKLKHAARKRRLDALLVKH